LTDQVDTATDGIAATPPSRGYLFIVIALSSLVMAFRFIDALILGMLLPHIKIEFSLSDSQVGLIGGLPFALCYSLFAIPLAWLADTRLRRTRVIAASIAIWSIMTSLSGAATGFLMLFVLRMCVGAGEAGFAPATYSLFRDIFPDSWRRRSVAILGIGGNLGQFAALALGGWSVETFGWRTTYLIVGLPGIFLALIYLYTVREPARKTAPVGGSQFLSDFGVLFSSPVFFLLFIGAGLSTASGFAMHTWMPSFLERAHGIGLAEAGFALGICFGIGGAIGPLLFGWLADRLSLKDRRWTLWLATALCVATAVPSAVTFLVQDIRIVYGALLLAQLVHGGALPLIIISAQDAAPRLTGSAVAVVSIGANLIGQISGPLLVGAVSDSFAHLGNGDSLRLGLMSLIPLIILAALPFWMAARRLGPDEAEIPDSSELAADRT
jgi:predicted MFS family arabinose efflux permease